MTTIAMVTYGGVVEWASDTAASQGVHVIQSEPKAWALPGVAWGVAGRVIGAAWCRDNPPPAHPDGLAEWAGLMREALDEAGALTDGEWEGEVLVGYSQPRPALYLVCTDFAVVRVTDNFYAIGSGRDYALGAMMMGADPGRAVRIAEHWDAHTSGMVCGAVP